MMQDLGYLNSGHLPPILQPLKNPSKLSQVSGEYIYENPDFKYTLPRYYMIPTSYKWKITSRNEDHYVQYSSKIMNNFSSGKIINSNHFISNITF